MGDEDLAALVEAKIRASRCIRVCQVLPRLVDVRTGGKRTALFLGRVLFDEFYLRVEGGGER